MTKLPKRFGFIDFDLDGEVRAVDVYLAYEVLGERLNLLGKDPPAAAVVAAYSEAAAEVFGQPVGEWPYGRARLFARTVLEAIDAEKKAGPGSGTPG